MPIIPGVSSQGLYVWDVTKELFLYPAAVTLELGTVVQTCYSLKLDVVVHICDSSRETMGSWWLFSVRLSQNNKMK